MFESIELSKTWEEIIPVNKGWSNDKKYHIKAKDGSEYLLRISDISLFEKKKKQFALMKKVEKLNINASKPIKFGKVNEEVYMLMSWLDGEDAQTAIPKLLDKEQYSLGVEAGKILQKLHTIAINGLESLTWWEKYQAKVKKEIISLKNSELKLPHSDIFINYVLKNIDLVKNREVKFQHGDYHVGNMIVNNGKIGIIDFDKNGIADPYDEFKPFCWNVFASEYFESGLIDGYFDDKIPEDFFPILALYSAESCISQLPWAVQFGEEEISVAFKVIESNLCWFDNYKTFVPSWYKKPQV